jgi:hypothetical protein
MLSKDAMASLASVRALLAGDMPSRAVRLRSVDQAEPAMLRALQRRRRELRRVAPHLTPATVVDAERAVGETEQKAARRLSVILGRPVDPLVVSAVAFQRWGHAFSSGRDTRLGDTTGQSPRTVQARRGRITRHLLDELKGGIED